MTDDASDAASNEILREVDAHSVDTTVYNSDVWPPNPDGCLGLWLRRNL